MALRAARDAEAALDGELRAVMREGAGVGEPAGVAVRGQLGPGVPEPAGGVDELAGALVPLVVGEEAAAPEVLAEERAGGGDHVPGGPAAGEVVERGEL